MRAHTLFANDVLSLALCMVVFLSQLDIAQASVIAAKPDAGAKPGAVAKRQATRDQIVARSLWSKRGLRARDATASATPNVCSTTTETFLIRVISVPGDQQVFTASSPGYLPTSLNGIESTRPYFTKGIALAKPFSLDATSGCGFTSDQGGVPYRLYATPGAFGSSGSSTTFASSQTTASQGGQGADAQVVSCTVSSGALSCTFDAQDAALRLIGNPVMTGPGPLVFNYDNNPALGICLGLLRPAARRE